MALITQDNFGAWLIKCDPEAKFDLPRAISDGLDAITEWSVVPGYRADMMRKSDRILLQGRVAGGIAAPGSLRSRRDSLLSPGSCHLPHQAVVTHCQCRKPRG